MFLFVCARMYTKLFVSRSKGWDDCRSYVEQRLEASPLTAQLDMCLLACVSRLAYRL